MQYQAKLLQEIFDERGRIELGPEESLILVKNFARAADSWSNQQCLLAKARLEAAERKIESDDWTYQEIIEREG